MSRQNGSCLICTAATETLYPYITLITFRASANRYNFPKTEYCVQVLLGLIPTYTAEHTSVVSTFLIFSKRQHTQN